MPSQDWAMDQSVEHFIQLVIDVGGVFVCDVPGHVVLCSARKQTELAGKQASKTVRDLCFNSCLCVPALFEFPF